MGCNNWSFFIVVFVLSIQNIAFECTLHFNGLLSSYCCVKHGTTCRFLLWKHPYSWCERQTDVIVRITKKHSRSFLSTSYLEHNRKSLNIVYTYYCSNLSTDVTKYYKLASNEIQDLPFKIKFKVRSRSNIFLEIYSICTQLYNPDHVYTKLWPLFWIWGWHT